MRRTLAAAVTLILLAWGAYSFDSKVSRVEPQIGVAWMDTAAGVMAETVIPREPGWSAGLRPGDRLQAVDGV